MSQNWLQHTLGERHWRPQRQAVALAALGLFIALIIGALYLSQVAGEATTGRILSELITQRDELELTNEQLRAEIASLKSVPRLLARAKELGFIEASSSNIEYLVVMGYDPHRTKVLVPTPDQPQDAAVYDETFSGWLQEQWDNLRRQFDSFANRGDS